MFVHCISAEYFQWQVGNYLVDYSGSPTELVGEYLCSCKAFRYNRTRPCKHILKVMATHCAWVSASEDTHGECPECGGEISYHLKDLWVASAERSTPP